MSTSSERRHMAETLAHYGLMKPHEVASFLHYSITTVKDMLDRGVLPTIGEGKRRRVDPLDVCVYALAERDNVSVDRYWELHGEAVPERAARYYRQILKLQAVAGQ